MKELTQKQKEFLDRYTKGIWKLNMNSGLVDIDGDFKCTSENLKDFKGIQFGEVKGGFYCSYNQLTSLAGAPRKVHGPFHCHNNLLTNLIGAPQEANEDFHCENNRLTSLKGAPKRIKGYFSCDKNQLVNLIGAPLEARYFYMDKGVSLKGLNAFGIQNRIFIHVNDEDKPIIIETERINNKRCLDALIKQLYR